MVKILQAFKVFDNYYRNQEEAEKVLSGWEHKERITPIFIIVDQETVFESHGPDDEGLDVDIIMYYDVFGEYETREKALGVIEEEEMG